MVEVQLKRPSQGAKVNASKEPAAAHKSAAMAAAREGQVADRR